MALIGEMHYLTIGGKTYSLPSGGEGSVTSVGISNATDGGITVTGSPITSSGSITIGHTNTLPAVQNTLAIYPIKIDKNGHISEYGSAVSIPTKVSDLTNDSGFITGMEILSYGSSTWQDFLTAYNAKKVVYCRASSNSNPASGSQTRLAFMAYVNNATTPTEVEFQYYRSVSSHSASQQGDQVYVYKLNKNTGWSVITREAMSKIAVGGDLTSSYANGTITISGDIPTVPTNVSAFTNDAGYLTTETDPTVPSWAKAESKPTYTYSEVGAAASSHSHGNITSGGDITTTATIANGDRIIINDESASKVTNSSITFGTSDSQYLANSGTWQNLPTIPTKVSDLTNDSGYITGYTETDPVFNASAASGIASSDISNWNGKIDNEYIGYLKNSILYIPKGWIYEDDGMYKSYGVPFYVSDANVNIYSSTNIRELDTTTNITTFGTINLDGEVKSSGAALSKTTLYMYIKLGNTSFIYTITTKSDIPTKVSDLTNDSGFITSYTETDPIFTASAAHGISSSDITNWNGKQAALVSGTNIKTVNNESLLGSGNITVSTVAAQIIRW